MLIGVVGKTNVGKSTFFKACTLAQIDIASHTFTTIKPNRGVAYVKVNCPCKDFSLNCNPQNSFCIENYRFVPFQMLDVAGLVPGAHEGRGLGNQFLDDLRTADAFIHVIDASGTTDQEGNTTTGYDPREDIRFLEKEVDLWFADVITKNIKKFKSQKPDIKKISEILSGLGVKQNHIITALKQTNLQIENVNDWNQDEIFNFSSNLRKISKPMIIAANKIDLPDSKKNIEIMKKEFPDYPIIPVCAEAELALREAAEHKLVKYTPGDSSFEIKGELNEKQKKGLDFIKILLENWKTTGVQEILNKLVLEILKNKVVYPVEDENKLTNKKGQVLPDAFILEEQATALDLAEKIHSDIAEKFIGAVDCRTKKRIGKDHVLKHGDVIRILI